MKDKGPGKIERYNRSSIAIKNKLKKKPELIFNHKTLIMYIIIMLSVF